MKIFVLCEKADKEAALTLLKLLKTIAITAAAFALDENWREEKQRLDELLAPCTHIIAIYTERSACSSWLAFVAGHSLGSDRPLVLYRPSRTTPQSRFLSPFFLVMTIEEMGAFLEAENREWTAVAGRREARRELLELGVSFRGDSFAESVKAGNAHAVDLFIKAGLPADSRDSKGVPLLCLAAREGHRAILDLLLERGASLDIQAEDRSNTALMDAAAGGQLDILGDLLKAGADVDLVSKDGQSALVLSVGKNNLPISRMLLEAGANPDLLDKLGFSARKYAALFHNKEMVELFEQFPPENVEKKQNIV